MKALGFLVAFGPLALLAPSTGPQHFSLTASFAPATKAGAPASVAVAFVGRDPDVHINESPAPRLALDAAQKVLVDKQQPPPARVEPYDPETAKYLDLALPVYFPVAIAKDAPKGVSQVAGKVTYFYCSKREGWCRKGTTEVELAVDVK